MQPLAARDIHPIRVLGHLRAHRPQVLHDQRDPVGLLHPQLPRISNPHPVRRVRRNRRQDRQLIDQLR